MIILVPTAYVVFTKTNGRHWICHLTFNLMISPNEVAKKLAAGLFREDYARIEIVRLSLKLPSFRAKACMVAELLFRTRQ